MTTNRQKFEGFTPGPWKALDDGGVAACDDEVGTDEMICTPGIKCDAAFFSNVPGRAEANARLIAAAPLLLETLRDLVEAITGNSYGNAQEYACKGGFDSEFIAASILLSQIDNDLL